MTNLEAEIRAALAGRADAIDADDLRGDQVRRRLVWPMLAAALVVALTAGSALWFTHRDHTSRATGADGLDGSVWRLVTVTTSSGTVTMASLEKDPSISFAGGKMYSQDANNDTSGRPYVPTVDGFRTRPGPSSVTSIGGEDPALAAAADAIRVVRSGADVRVQLRGDTLVLSVWGYTLSLRRGGRALTDVVGFDWWLVSVTTGGQTYTVPNAPREQPRLILYPDGRLFADDSVNSYDGHYRASGGGYVVVGTVWVSAVGTTPDVVLDALRLATGTIASGSEPVTVRVYGNRLVLTAGHGVSATYVNHGPARAR